MARTAFVYHPIFLEHDTGSRHPESPQRLAAIHDRLKERGLLDRMLKLTPSPAPLEAVTRIHNPGYVAAIERESRQGGRFYEDSETVGSPATYQAAMTAAGAVLAAIDAVMAREADNAFCAVRPPGHHAERDRAMGFCFLNNVAIGARHVQDRHSLRKVAIIDWDVHHGNGTQAAFVSDPSVFYFSIHQYPHYPGSGRRSEQGVEAGRGFTLNSPMAAGATDADYQKAFCEDLLPALERFQPDFILISAGFDAHRDDPLGGMQLTEEGFGSLTRMVRDVADARCAGRVVSVLEGGYHLAALAASVEAHVNALMA